MGPLPLADAGTYVNLMAQYHPAGLVGRNKRDSYAEINRRLAHGEYDRAETFARELGLRRLPGTPAA